MLIKLISASATKPAAKVKVPESISEFALKGKFRIKSAQPGHYILTGSRAKFKMIAIMRLVDESRFAAGLNTKAFVAKANQDLNVGDTQAEASDSRRPSIPGQGDSKKPKAVPPGWYMFIRDSQNKVTKEFIGARISARRLLNIIEGKPAVTESKPVKPNALVQLKKLDNSTINTIRRTVEGKKLQSIEEGKVARAIQSVLGKDKGISAANLKAVYSLLQEHKLLSKAKPALPKLDAAALKQLKSLDASVINSIKLSASGKKMGFGDRVNLASAVKVLGPKKEATRDNIERLLALLKEHSLLR